MSRAAVAITLSEAERRELEGLARRRKTAQGLARRARIVLAAAEGLANKTIVERLGADANTVGKWRRRFLGQLSRWRGVLRALAIQTLWHIGHLRFHEAIWT